MKEQLADLLGRKMLVFYLTLAAITFLTLHGSLTGDNFMIILMWAISNIVYGNVQEWKAKTSTIQDLQISNKDKVNFLKD